MIRSCPHICCSCKECRSGLLCQTRVTAQKQCSLVIYVLTHTASCYSVLLSPSGGRGFAISCLRDFCINHHMPGYACVTDICVHSVHAWCTLKLPSWCERASLCMPDHSVQCSGVYHSSRTTCALATHWYVHSAVPAIFSLYPSWWQRESTLICKSLDLCDPDLLCIYSL